MLSGQCLRPLQSSGYVKVLRKCISSNTRNLTYALQSAEEVSNRGSSDQTLKQQDLLQTLSCVKTLKEMASKSDYLAMEGGPITDYWQRRNEIRIPVREDQETASSIIPEVLLEENPIPRILWHDTFEGDDEYWKRKKQQQIEMEQSFVDEALLEYKQLAKNARKHELAATLPSTKHLLLRWIPPLAAAIQDEQTEILNGRSSHSKTEVGQLVALLEPEELAVLTIHSKSLLAMAGLMRCWFVAVMGCLLKGNLEDDSSCHCAFVAVASRLGKAVQAHINLLKLKLQVQSENRRRRMLHKYVTSVKNGLNGESLQAVGNLKEWEKNLVSRAIKMDVKIRLLKNQWNKKGVHFKEVIASQWRLGDQKTAFTAAVSIQIGAWLVSLFKRVAWVKVDRPQGKVMAKDSETITSLEPVLKHEVIWQPSKFQKPEKRKLGVLAIHPSVIKIVETNESHSLFSHCYPMVYPPNEWRNCSQGGYLSIPNRVMRSQDSLDSMKLLVEADKHNQNDQVYDALTILGRTPWKINKDVLEVVEEVWRRGGGMLELPSRHDVPIPDPLSPRFRLASSKGAFSLTFGEETELESLQRRWESQRAKKKNSELHSLRCDVELKLASARKFLHEDRIYFPHNMDFRGRAYPLPPHLNHMGNDMCRGLLLFAEGKALGSTGLHWLYIQVANLYGSGEDKKPLEGRLKFALENLDSILDSANQPLDGLQWWMNGDSPWQLLATCMEIRNVLNSENPESCISHIHVHQDGSCNGLQHYAALGRDGLGAVAVNLGSSDRPNDVYSEIATVVQRIVSKDAANGHRWAQILDGHVDRKLVKQTVMTSVYGVTFVGARQQIFNRLKERGWEDNHELYEVSFYAAKVTMTGLHEMFKSAKDVMHWLSECAQLIARTNQTVSWTTPLGLPVAQPYRQRDIKAVKTVLQQVNLSVSNRQQPVMKNRQRTAFPPNYIHSLDSTHMMMTALGCHQRGVTFAGVHDSFWTHASSVDEMNVILREKFYELHSRPLLKELLQQFQERHRNQTPYFPEVPTIGNFDLKEILNAKYFFN